MENFANVESFERFSVANGVDFDVILRGRLTFVCYTVILSKNMYDLAAELSRKISSSHFNQNRLRGCPGRKHVLCPTFGAVGFE